MSNYFISVKELPSSEQPRERLRDFGPQALSDAEILAILLRVGVQGMNVIQLAQLLLREHGGWHGLQKIEFSDLCRVRGMGEAKAAHIKAALEIGRRLLLAAPNQPLQITSPADVVGLLQVEMSHLDKEHLRVVILNTKNHVLKIENVTIGSLNSASVRIAEVFREPIRLNAAAIIVVHNHPSGDPTPSPDDILVTKQLIQAGQLLDIDVLDHLVIGQARWVSMRERRLAWL
ncbi:MAG: DNA repair protein RadC [Chloroflexi bacterium]|nr:DNA repair protein RadC [Chloroflexota bacterium]